MCNLSKTVKFLYNVNCPSISGAITSISSKLRPDDILRDVDKQYIIMSILDINMSLVKAQDLICRSGNLAAFRTPFYSANEEPIYALLKETEDRMKAPQPYSLIDFVIEGEGSGKLLKRFTSTPSLPTFSKDRSDYLYDPSIAAPSVDFPHVIERLHKMPIKFLSTLLNVFGVDSREFSENEISRQAKELILTVPMANQMFRAMFSGTVAAAAKAAAADPYLARAMYYPRRDIISLLLPLCFTNKGTADCALVVSKEASGYVGQTILSITEAYTDARLLGNVKSTWLVPSNTTTV